MLCFLRTLAGRELTYMNILQAGKLEVFLAEVEMLGRVRGIGDVNILARPKHT